MNIGLLKKRCIILFYVWLPVSHLVQCLRLIMHSVVDSGGVHFPNLILVQCRATWNHTDQSHWQMRVARAPLFSMDAICTGCTLTRIPAMQRATTDRDGHVPSNRGSVHRDTVGLHFLLHIHVFVIRACKAFQMTEDVCHYWYYIGILSFLLP